jgi:hypothetical protein
VPLYNYFELAANFELPAVEALAFFQAKGLKPTFAWQDMLGDEHDLAFTVAKMMDNDLLATVKNRLDRALDDGKTLQDRRMTVYGTNRSWTRLRIMPAAFADRMRGQMPALVGPSR